LMSGARRGSRRAQMLHSSAGHLKLPSAGKFLSFTAHNEVTPLPPEWQDRCSTSRPSTVTAPAKSAMRKSAPAPFSPKNGRLQHRKQGKMLGKGNAKTARGNRQGRVDRAQQIRCIHATFRLQPRIVRFFLPFAA
jgi:hypothetical protein